MNKKLWITVPAVAVGLGLIFLGGSVFAQEPDNNTAPGVNWTAMYDYCQNLFSGNATSITPDWDEMHSYCGNAAENGTFDTDEFPGPGGMMGYGTYGMGGMMGGLNGLGGTSGGANIGRGMMGW